MSGGIKEVIRKGIPAYVWVALLYVALLGVVWLLPPQIEGSAPATTVVEQPAEAAPAEGAPAEGAAEAAAEAPAETAATPAPDAAYADEITFAEQVGVFLERPLFSLPLLSGVWLPVSIGLLMIVACLVSAWIEVVRATHIRTRGGNDVLSLLATVGMLVLFIGVAPFGTQAFLVIVVTGIGDLLLDRIVGQAVARRDFGGFGGMSE